MLKLKGNAIISIHIAILQSYYDKHFLNIKLDIDGGKRLHLEKDNDIMSDNFCLYKIDCNLRITEDNIFIKFMDLISMLRYGEIPTQKSNWMQIPYGYVSPRFVIMNKHLHIQELCTSNCLYKSMWENGRVKIDMVVAQI